MAAKNWRGKSGPGLIWRLVYGHNGPTRARLRAELEKKLGVKLTDTFVVPTRDSAGRVRKQTWRINPDGTTAQVRQEPKKKTAAKPAAKRTASKPSKPSRASKTGSTQRRQAAAPAAPTVRAAKPQSMRERGLRDAGGRYAGSRKADQAYQRASKRAEKLLGWDQK